MISKKQIGWARTAGWRSSCMLLAVLVWSGCATPQYDPVSGRQVRNLYTLDDDIQIGRGVIENALQEFEEQGIPVNQDQQMLSTLSNMMHRIAAVSHYPDLPYTVVLVHTNIVNAACAPGGQLIFWEGLYDPKIGLVQNEDELAAVMAHEIAHATARHSTRSMTRNMPINLALMAGTVAASLADRDDLALWLGAGFVVYQGIILPRYSRQDEYEADRLGLFYMADAGYDPRAAPAIWRRVNERERDPGLLRYLSSHPTHRDRYRELERHLPEALERYERARGRAE